MSFYIYALSSGAAVVFCFDTPIVFQESLSKTMNTKDRVRSGDVLSFLQCMIVGEVSKLYDRSIWTIREYIRNIEKVRLIAQTASVPPRAYNR